MIKRSTHTRGLTLMELTLYVGIASIMLIITSLFLSTLLQSRIKNQTIAEVDQQGLQVMQMMTQTLRNAQTINSPSSGTLDSSLSVDTYATNNNPTLFYLSDGVVMVQENSRAAIPLTNTQVRASNLIFTNTSNTGTPGIIRVSFTLTNFNTQDWYEFNFNKTFYASASLRQP